MRKVGITGGMGSGKSYIGALLLARGYPVFSADDAAKALLAHDPEVIATVRNIFGAEAYLIDGSPNKPWLAAQVFGNAGRLAQLNAILHPATFRAAGAWFEEQTGDLAFKEAAILFEAGGATELDFVVEVYAPKTLRIERSLARQSGQQRGDVLARMNRQWPESRKCAAADFILFNDGYAPLQPQLDALLKQLLT